MKLRDAKDWKPMKNQKKLSKSFEAQMLRRTSMLAASKEELISKLGTDKILLMGELTDHRKDAQSQLSSHNRELRHQLLRDKKHWENQMKNETKYLRNTVQKTIAKFDSELGALSNMSHLIIRTVQRHFNVLPK